MATNSTMTTVESPPVTESTPTTWTYVDYGDVLFSLVDIITIPVYTAFLVCIIKYRRQLNSSFFTLNISMAVADLVCIVHRCITEDWAMRCQRRGCKHIFKADNFEQF